jgi:hypothetical protein
METGEIINKKDVTAPIRFDILASSSDISGCIKRLVRECLSNGECIFFTETKKGRIVCDTLEQAVNEYNKL